MNGCNVIRCGGSIPPTEQINLLFTIKLLSIMLRKIDNFEAVRLVENGANIYHVFAPEGFCYVISNILPSINNSYNVVKIDKKFAKNPRLYATRDFYKGWFWYAFNL